MDAYTIDPTDSSRPADSDEVLYAAAELRELKNYIASSIIANGGSTLNKYFRDAVDNRIINPGYEFGLGTGATPADLWKYSSSGNVITPTRTAFTLGQTDVPDEPKYYMSHAVTANTGIASYAYTEQRIEGVRTFSNNHSGFYPTYYPLHVSLYAKASTAGLKLCIDIVQNFGTGGTPSPEEHLFFGIALDDLATTWTRYSYTPVLTSLAGKTLGTNGDDYLAVRVWFSAGSNYDAITHTLGPQSGTFDLASISAIIGATDAYVRPRPFAEEQELVSRYVQRFGGAVGQEICAASAWTTTSVKGLLNLPTPMRKAPTVSYAGTTATDYLMLGATNKAPTGTLAGAAVSNKAVTLTWPMTATAPAISAQTGLIMTSNSVSGIITLDASL